VIRKIHTHFGLLPTTAWPPPLAHGPSDLTAAPFNDWLAPSADDYLTNPLYLYEVYS
jgi:hypothetical protein